jgi:hypothetical protein
MIRTALFSALVFSLALLGGCSTTKLRPVSIAKVNVLPLALSDDFEFRKTLLFLNDDTNVRTSNEMLTARRRKINFGAVDSTDANARKGNYFTFYWRAHRQTALTVRLEYRTEKLGDYVQAREITYLRAKGSHRTDFAVIGDDYLDDGRITAWRAILIENGQIVALNQSFLWN